MGKIEELYKIFEKNQVKQTVSPNFYESELESAHAMDIAINRELSPPMFFEDGFNLGDISTFQQIFSEEAMTTSLLLQEKVCFFKINLILN